jgi:hypothetical protein
MVEMLPVVGFCELGWPKAVSASSVTCAANTGLKR